MVAAKVSFENNFSILSAIPQFPPPPACSGNNWYYSHIKETLLKCGLVLRIFRFSIGDGKCPGWYVSGMVNVLRVSVHRVSARGGN